MKDIDIKTLLLGFSIGVIITLFLIFFLKGSNFFCQGVEYYSSANKSLEIQNKELQIDNEELARVKEGLAIENARLRAQMKSGLQVEEEQKALDTKEKELDRREQKINKREEGLEEREKVIYSKEQDLFDSVGQQREEVGKAKQIQEDISLYTQRYDDCIQKNEDLKNAVGTWKAFFFVSLSLLIVAIIIIWVLFKSNRGYSNEQNPNERNWVDVKAEDSFKNLVKGSGKKALEGDNPEENNSEEDDSDN
jgi:hypothetical protein